MLCPSCGVDQSRVIDSRPAEGGVSIRRRRECELCGHRFTTYERLEPQLMVKKRDGRLEPFSATKLAAGVSSALADRPVSGTEMEALVGEMVEALQQDGVRQVTSDEVGLQVLERLKSLDEVAYLRFASVYKGFEGAADFEKEMAALDSAEE